MNKYFFEESEKEIKRVSYSDYKNNISIMRKINDTYNKGTKSIEVEIILQPFAKWEFDLKGTKFILYVEKKFTKDKETTSVYVDCDDEKKIRMMERGFSKFEVYNTDLNLKKVEEVTKKDFYKATSRLRRIINNCWIDEEREYIVERY